MSTSEHDFYLGRLVDAESGAGMRDPFLYDPDDLTTHGVVVGMTGSGKTGLCIDLLEEAALQNIPVIMIDPKGDITNTLLHFPELRPEDFQPWVNLDGARRENRSVEEAATAAAELWRNGLAEWDIGPERIQRLAEAARFAVYTPGSDAGLPVSILASLSAPDLSWSENREAVRDRIGSTVTALLGLTGLTELDPVQSREHILLSSIFEQAWSQGRDLSLEELIIQSQNPPFEKLGVFEVDTFFPEKERFGLAMRLNSILAAPSFQSWLEGEPLDVGAMLMAADGRPRHSVFYIAHLDDAERMFFVTLLFSAVESWIRAQKGTPSLRAILYFDEIFGYLPPVSNPPSKAPMLRLLKQARAFGVGLLLATQNPVDVDYKALSNAGSWFIGKLGTEQDKARLLDGLSTAMGGELNRGEYDQLISGLGKRVFLARNVHEKQPQLFQTRWAMNYLAGPLTRAQLPALNALVGAESPPPPPDPLPQEAATQVVGADPPGGAEPPGHRSRPAIPSRVAEYVLQDSLTLREAAHAANMEGAAQQHPALIYVPQLLAQAEVRYQQRKYDLDVSQRLAALTDAAERVGWEHCLITPLGERELQAAPSEDARFLAPEGALADPQQLRALQSDFEAWLYRTQTITIRANEPLALFASPDESDADFAERCEAAAQHAATVEIDKVDSQFERKLDQLEDKLTREQRELADDEAEYSARRQEEVGSHLGTVFDLFRGRRSSSAINRSLSKRRMTERAKREIQESREEVAELEAKLEALARERDEEVAKIEQRWADIAWERSEIGISPYKKDIHVTHFGIAWVPHHLISGGGIERLLPAVALDAAEAATP